MFSLFLACIWGCSRVEAIGIIVFLAIMLDRRAFSMRSVTVAALVTLMLHPEALISVGFQMSFAAVAALVVVYREWDARRTYVPNLSLWSKLKNNFTALTVTSSWVIGVFGLGFLLAALGQGKRRVLGFALGAICFVFWSQTPRPDMRISDSGQVAFWDDAGEYLYVGRKRADRFGRSQFMQRGGQPDSEMQGYKDELANCDDLACRFMVKGHQVSVVNHPSEVAEECAQSDIVVLTQREAGPVARRGPSRLRRVSG